MNTWKQLTLLLTAALFLVPRTSSQRSSDVVAWWKFDDRRGNVATDSVSGHADNILNHHRWVKGVSGTGLKFDGFTTLIERAPEQVPKLGPQFSIEAWIAIQSYPWNWVAIVDQEMERREGYYFGIDAKGHLGLQLAVWGNWESCVSETRLPLMKWTHVVGTYHPLSGISIYIDGKLTGKLAVTGRMSPANKTGLRIGRNFKDLSATALVRESASFPAYYSLDGIIDELKIYNRTLDAEETANGYDQLRPSSMPEFEARRWPSLPVAKHFGAVYTQLKLYPEWDALWRTGPYSDIVVNFADAPFHYVFWRGANFGESMVTENGIWVGDQSFESGTKVGTAEHMNDKHNMHSRINIVENTDARVVLHWCYGLVDVIGNFSNVDAVTGWGDWADEFFYIYPDGVAVRYGTIYGTDKEYSFTEPTILIEPGKKPEDYVWLQAATVANSKGASRTYSWDPFSPPFPFPDPPSGANIAVVNLKSDYKPFYIYQPGTTLGPYGWPPELRPEYSHFPVWDHWPVNQIPSDGRYALFPDHFGSAAVMSPDPNKAWVEGQGPTKSTYFLFGLTRQSASDLALLDRSWLQPPLLRIEEAEFTSKYDPAQRAYVLTQQVSGSATVKPNLRIMIDGSERSPLVNPAFVIKNWGNFRASIKMDGNQLSRQTVRTGLIERLDGTDLVLWIRKESTSAVHLTISAVDH
jgi:hypothetical protein